MEALSDPLFKPDVRVTYIGPGYKSGKYLYRFKVENIGAASSDDIFVDETVRQTTYDGSTGALLQIGGPKLSLGSGESTVVTVSCTPKPRRRLHRCHCLGHGPRRPRRQQQRSSQQVTPPVRS